MMVNYGLSEEEVLGKAHKDKRAGYGDDVMKLSKFKLSMILLAIFFCFSPLGYSQGQDVDKLIQELKDGKPDDRITAADKLGEIKDSRAVEPLISALKDESSDVRKRAARALGQIGDPRAFEPLIAALKDGNSDVRWNAARALGWITGKYFEKDPVKWQKWWEENKKKLQSGR